MKQLNFKVVPNYKFHDSMNNLLMILYIIIYLKLCIEYLGSSGNWGYIYACRLNNIDGSVEGRKMASQRGPHPNSHNL